VRDLGGQCELAHGGFPQSLLMRALRITCAYLSVSLAMKAAKRSAATGQRRDAAFGEGLHHGRRLERRLHLGVDTRDDGVGHAPRRQQAVPRVRFQLQPLFGQRGQVGGIDRTLGRGHAQRHQLAALHVAAEFGPVAEHHRHLAAQQVGQRRGLALVGHVDQVDAGGGLEHLARQVGRGALAERRVAERARRLLRRRHQVGQGLEAAAGVRGQHMLAQAHQRHRAQVARGVVGQVLHQRLVDAEAVGHGDEAVAVGRRLGHRVDTDHGAGAGLVVHQHRLAQRSAQFGGDEPGDDVGGAAGRKGHDDADGLGRPGLCAGRQGGQRGGGQQVSTLHVQTPQCGMWCEPSDTHTFLGSRKTS
jgi:hypothetical protein